MEPVNTLILALASSEVFVFRLLLGGHKRAHGLSARLDA